MNTPESIAENYNKIYSIDGKGDKPTAGLFAGLTAGVVVDTDDPLQEGRLRIFCPSLNDNPKKVHHLPWASYVSPFLGSINNSEYYRGADPENSTSEGSLHYGFWAIPEQGAHVLVGCIDGDPRRRFWIGCLPEHQQTNTLHHGRYKWDDGNVEGPLTGNNSPMQPLYDNMKGAFNYKSDSPEFRSRVAEYQTAAISEDVGQVPNDTIRDGLDQQNSQIRANDPDTWEHATLGAHGYDWSGFKAIGGFMSSRVFGFSTPGMHALTMDDRPFNSRVRLRTTAGHQILMDDTNERIYIATYDGNNYIEMDRSGNIDCYSSNRISFHAKKDINFNTDETFRVFARKGIHLYAGSDILDQDIDNSNLYPEGVIRQTPLEFPPQSGEIRIHAAADLHVKSEQNIRQLSLNDTFMESNGDWWGKVNKSSYLQVETDINITTNKGDYNLAVANNVNENVDGHSKRFTMGNSSVSSNGRNEIFSFTSTLDMGALENINMKSSNSGVMIEAQGNGGAGGNVSIRTPNSQIGVGDDGLQIMTDKAIKIKSEDNLEIEVRPSGPKLSSPISINGIPEIDTPVGITLPEVPWDGSRTTITLDEAVRVAFNAGFTGKDLPIAVAVMMGESSLRTSVTNPEASTSDKWGDVVGLFQIRTLKNPDAWTGVDRLRDNRQRQLEDPNWNAKVGYEIFSKSYPPNEWTVGKWEVFGGKHAGKLVSRNLAAATTAVNRVFGNTPSTSSAPEYSMMYVMDDESTPLSMMSLSNFGSMGSSALSKSVGTSIQLSSKIAKLQSMTDVEIKTLGGMKNNVSFNSLVSKVDEIGNAVNQTSTFLGGVMPMIVKGLATSGAFTLTLPMSFSLPCIDFYSFMPPELLNIAASLDDLNGLLQDVLDIPLTIENMKYELEGNVAALQVLGLPLSFKFDMNMGDMLCVDKLEQLDNIMELFDIPVLELPSFNPLVDRIFANNSIDMNLLDFL